ncbi:siderophore-interacting protein [Enterovirga rhinocerotis]|uniref:NADPH-dependent ferric siderophore reductase n=1 Tax=Enterovirga rhinocerotis TaxID=1339210 RepID=A0A4R7BJK1_9HYPH|nr:siderophore-interacting protein [Enterovirga rhinocerotis]TDR85173.1 NADPH-dependent ferric siderophore reductase [Enterovirga rhinocerotis]
MTQDSGASERTQPEEHRVVVLDTIEVTPLVRRLVFGGERLGAAFTTPDGAHAPYLKLVLGAAETPIIRTYSIRHLDAARDEMQVDFVLHAEEGPGSAFGRSARRGATARLRGPGHLAVARCSDHRLFADHCGLPALAHLLEHLPPEARGTAAIEVPDASEIQTLRAPGGVAITWLLRPPGAPSALADRFASSPAEPDARDLLVWAGAEAAIARRVRASARTRWQVPPQRCQVLNYWRHGRAEGTFSFVA